MAQVFLTGATGFVGSFVARELIARQHRVTCLIRSSSNRRWLNDLPVDYCIGSLMQTETFLEALKKSDYVLHVAGVTSAKNEQGYIEGNVRPTESLLRAIDTYHPEIRRFLLVSSQAAVGPSPSEKPIDESHPYQPLTDYGRSKMLSEKIAHGYISRIPITIVRPPAVYGPRDTGVYNFFKLINRGLNLMVGKTDQLVSLVYVEDLARGIVQAAFSPQSIGQTYFLCEEAPYYWSQVTQLTAQILNRKYLTIKLPYSFTYTIAFIVEKLTALSGSPSILNRQKMNELRQPFWVISPQRAQRDFQYQTVFPLPVGLKKTIDWYKEQRWL